MNLIVGSVKRLICVNDILFHYDQKIEYVCRWYMYHSS